MITSNVLQRVFHIRVNGSTGSAFMLDIDDRQYMVTAKHVVGDLTAASVTIEMMVNNAWLPIQATIVGHAPFAADITVLALPRIFATKSLTLPIAEHNYLGQEVYFLGFPFGQFTDVGAVNNNWPMAFVKRAIISSFNTGGEPSIVFLDGHNNPGFSGGPVVAKRPGSDEFELISVISGYRFNPEPVLHQGTASPDLTIHANTGIILSYHVMHVRQIAQANPIGFAV